MRQKLSALHQGKGKIKLTICARNFIIAWISPEITCNYIIVDTRGDAWMGNPTQSSHAHSAIYNET